jgi:hypothetical protein
MNRFLRALLLRPRQSGAAALPSPTHPLVDPRAERYFAIAARYNAAAADLGYQSLEHAVRAGKMPDVLRRASQSPGA